MSDYPDLDVVVGWETERDSDDYSFRLKIYRITWDTSIVIMRNLSDKPFQKIADSARKIISLLSNNYNLAPNKMMLIEHYPVDDSSDEDTYLQVLLTNNELIRYEIEKNKLIELIGKPI